MESFEKLKQIQEDDKLAKLKERANEAWPKLPRELACVLTYFGKRLDMQQVLIQRLEGEVGALERALNGHSPTKGRRP